MPESPRVSIHAMFPCRRLTWLILVLSSIAGAGQAPLTRGRLFEDISIFWDGLLRMYDVSISSAARPSCCAIT